MAYNENDQLLWRQFERLGEMIGDGLHYESDGKWITKEYKKLSHILIPELKEEEKERRKHKANHIDEQMKSLMEIRKCNCGGTLVQKRKGTKVCYCSICDTRYVARAKK